MKTELTVAVGTGVFLYVLFAVLQRDTLALGGAVVAAMALHSMNQK